jgi:hypothetical protein
VIVMASRLTVSAALALLVLLLVGGSTPLTAEADDPAPVAAPNPTARATGTLTVASHGTAWVAERRNKFSLWRPVGWGTQARVKLAGVGDQWVHIQVPAESFVNGYMTGLYSAQFCAQSSNGAQTRPIQIDMWNGTTRFYTAAINWWTDNAEHCWVVNFTPAKWTVTMGISVLVHFANTTDQITLGWASASFMYG